MLIIWPVYQIITFNSPPVYQIQLYLACKCLLWHWHIMNNSKEKFYFGKQWLKLCSTK